MAVNFDIIRTFRDYLDRNDWKYEFIPEKEIIRCNLGIKGKLKNLRLIVDFNEYGFTNYAICQINADESSRDEVAKYLHMANYGLRNGNFEIDYRDGEVRYKIYTNCDGMSELPDEVMLDCMIIGPKMFEKYGDGLAALMMGFSDAETEIEKAE